MSSAVRSGARLDQLAELEEERRFLLRSLRDLEREHDAGDVDDDDYATLKDGYTVRAAAVLRQIGDGEQELPPKRPARWGLIAAVVAAVVFSAGAIGLVLAQAWGERGVDQEITGFTPGDEVRTVLANARAAIGSGDWSTANDLYLAADGLEQERGVDNPEARAYFGWTLALLTANNPDQQRSDQLLDAAVLALGQAIQMDENYADPYCFVAIIEFRFRDDAAAALPYIETCETSNPPADIAGLVSNLGDEIRAEAG